MSAIQNIDSEFFVQLFSNANAKDVDNTTSHFSNTLAKAISLPRGENWHVALAYILCSNKFDVGTHGEEGSFEFSAEEEKNLSQVYVKCHQVTQLHDGRQLISCHSRKPYNREYNRIHYYEPFNLLYFPVKVQELTDITISLHKPDLRPLFLRRSQPTTISLKFKKMSEKIIPIYVSSRRNEAQNRNRASKFTVDIPYHYTNYGSYIWEIALATFTYIPDFIVFPSHYTKINFFEITQYSPDDEVEINVLTPQLRRIDNQVSLTNDTIRSWRNEQDIRRYLHDLMGILKFANGEPMSTALQFENMFIESEDGEPVSYSEAIKLVFIKPCKFYMPSWLADIIGFRQYETDANGTVAVFSSLTPYWSIPVRTPFNAYTLIPNSISIICDFIQPLLVGSVESKVLRTIPVQNRFTEVTPSETFEPKNFQFHKLATREISTLNFYLVDSAGNEIEFRNQNQDIIIGLVLKMIV